MTSLYFRERLLFLLSALLGLAVLTGLARPAYAADMIEVPVLAKNVQKDEIVSRSDIDWIKVPSRQVRAGTVTEANDILGLTPRRAQAAGKLLRRIEFQEPIVVRKGAYVTMVLKHGPLTLTAQGRALEDGAQDQEIRVQNVESKQTVQGRVAGAGVIEIRGRIVPQTLAMN